MVTRNLNDSTAVTVLFMMVRGGRAGGVLLKSTIISTVLSMLNSRLLRLEQTCHRLELQELDGGVFRCAVIRVKGEEQWGENTALRSSSAYHTGAG